MKKIAIVILVLLVPALWSAKTQENGDNFLLQNRQAGKLKIGMTVDELNTIYRLFTKRLVDIDREGFFTPAIEVYLQKVDSKNPSIVAEFRGNLHQICQIQVIDKRFKTTKGIGVGSTLGDLRKAYTVNRIDWGEAGFFAKVEEIGIVFILDTGTPPGWPDKKDPKLFPDNAKTNSIFIN